MTTSQTHEQVMAQVQQLLPLIQKRVPQTEQLRRQLPETIQEMLDAGLARTLMPKRWGGYELPLDTLVNSVIEIAKIDASAGWSYSFLLIHAWLLALFPDGAQHDVWSETPDVPMATSLAPEGRATQVEGGYRLSGKWAWSSGVEYCKWTMLAALHFSPDHHPEALVFLLPCDDYQIVDTWHVAGLQASGSQDVVVENAFIPTHRTVNLHTLLQGQAPGARENTGPLYNLPLIGAFPTALSSVILGSTLGAFETWKSYSQKQLAKEGYGQAERIAGSTPLYIRLAEAAGTLDSLQLLLERALDTLRAGGPLDESLRIRNRRDYAYIALQCRRTVNTIYEASGAWANFDWHPVQRHWRDVNAIAPHIALRFDISGEAFGRAALGLPRNQGDAFA